MENSENLILKRCDNQYVFSFLTREINLLNDPNTDKLNKKKIIESIHNFIVKEKPNFKIEVIQEILISFNKQFIKIALFDELEKLREFSILTLT